MRLWYHNPQQQVAQSMMGGDALEVGGERVAVGKLQVALLGSARELQSDLDRIADRADTSTTEGLHYVLQETVLALQRNPDYWVYGASELQFERGYDEAEAVFNELSLDERSKFRSETLSNFAGDSRSKEMKNQYEGLRDVGHGGLDGCTRYKAPMDIIIITHYISSLTLGVWLTQGRQS